MAVRVIHFNMIVLVCKFIKWPSTAFKIQNANANLSFKVRWEKLT